MRKWFKMIVMVALSLSLCFSGAVSVWAEQENDAMEEVRKIRQERNGLEPIEVMDPSEVTELSNSKYSNAKSSVSVSEIAYWRQFSSNYYYNQLTDAEKEIWTALEVECIRAVTGTGYCDSVEAYYDANELGWSNEDIVTFMFTFKYSNPQYYFLENTIGYGGSGSNSRVLIKVYDEFADGNERAAYTAQFKSQVDEWVAQVAEGKRPENKVKIATDIIALNTDYKANEFDQSAYSMVCLGETVCAGYTQTLQILLNANGIETIEVTSRCHAWNLVKIHGYWYGVDITWADVGEVFGREDVIAYDCYLKSSETFRSYDAEGLNDHVPEVLWDGRIPESKYDVIEAGYASYRPAYFTEGDYTYFSINSNSSIADNMATVVDTANGASVDEAPKQVNYEEKDFTVYAPIVESELDNVKPDITIPDNTKPEDTKPEDTKPDDTKPDDTKPEDTKPDDTVVLNGLNPATDGNWYKYINGVVDAGYTGLYCDENYGWWLVLDGRVAFDYTGLYCDPSLGWWLVGEGAVAFDYTGLWCDPVYGWWLVGGGSIAFDYTGLWCDPNYGWWLVGGGAVAFDYTGLWGDPTYGWWLINGGAVDFGYTGLYCDPNYGWWLIGNGAIAFDYHGLWGDPVYGWWLINGGSINFGYTGLYYDVNVGWWYIEGGALNFGYTGVVYHDGVPYNVVNGALM